MYEGVVTSLVIFTIIAISKPASFSESDAAEWLNILGRVIGVPHQQRCCRICSSSSCNLPSSGSTSIRKPDIALIDQDEYENPRVHPGPMERHSCICRGVSQDSHPQRMFNTINEKSYIIFLNQDSALMAVGTSPLPSSIVLGQVLYASGKESGLSLLRTRSAHVRFCL